MEHKVEKFYSMMGLLQEGALPGSYNDNQWRKFDNLGQVLNIMEKGDRECEDKHSIPDVYGRAIQQKITFETLRNKSQQRYILTRDILIWRGILTAIALQDFLDLKMRVDYFRYTAAGNPFDEALMHPITLNMFSQRVGWDEGAFYILSLIGDNDAEGEDMALFSPMTLFYPVADLEMKMPVIERLKWFDYEKRRFIDPVDVLSQTEKFIVNFWLDNLIRELDEDLKESERNGRDEKYIQKEDMISIIKFHLDAYKEQVSEELSSVAIAQKKCMKLKDIYAGLQDSVPAVIRKICNTTVEVSAKIKNITLYFKDIFTEQIYYYYYTKKSKDPFKDCSFHKKHQVIMGDNLLYAFLPLSRKVVERCDREQIDLLVKSLSMQYRYAQEKKEAAVIAKFALSEISPDNVDIEKTYILGNGYEETKEFPLIAIWPPVYYPEWKNYFIYLSGGRDEKIKVVYQNIQTGSNPYAYSVPEFPKAISLFLPNGDSGGCDLGIVLPQDEISHPATVSRAQMNAIVGIDFGTSGTSVFVKQENTGEIFPMTGRSVSPVLLTTAGESELSKMGEYFINVQQETEKLYSVYRRSSKEMQMTVQPVLDGVVYQAQKGDIIEYSQYFMPDIKWQNTKNDSYYCGFIEELCMRIWSELRERGITSVEWRYALPESLGRKDAFNNLWDNDILPYLKKHITVQQTPSKAHYSESEAASVYFMNSQIGQAVNVEKGYLVVDIGGGSTDIALWQKQNDELTMVAQVSVPVAGRMLFTRWIAWNLDIMKDQVFATDEQKVHNLTILKNLQDIAMQNAVLERMINENNDVVLNAYIRGTDWSNELKEKLEFGMAMLFFALGSLTGHLQKEGDLQPASGEGNFCVAVGGNGSKILKWLEKDEDKLLQMFLKGIESRNVIVTGYNLRMIPSEKPKEEVARGLVQDEIDHIQKRNSTVAEQITDAMALDWNEAFVSAYNYVFQRQFSVDRAKVSNLLTTMDRNMDVCNFFMNEMYIKHYMPMLSNHVLK